MGEEAGGDRSVEGGVERPGDRPGSGPRQGAVKGGDANRGLGVTPGRWHTRLLAPLDARALGEAGRGHGRGREGERKAQEGGARSARQAAGEVPHTRESVTTEGERSSAARRRAGAAPYYGTRS